MPALIAGRFSTEGAELLGRGGMGEVYRGLDRRTGAPVAIKVLKPEHVASGKPRVLTRFASEAEALRKLNHPNIVELVAHEIDEGRHYLIMQYVAGGSLRARLDAEGRLSLREAVYVSLQLCDALARVHLLGIVHRDVKPDNVLMGPENTPLLTDFGIAHLADHSRITERGDVLGTLPYLSPEGCEGAALDARADLWALGVTLFELLTGERPFVGETVSSLVAAITSQPPRSARALRPEIPPALERLVLCMLSKDRRARSLNARQVGGTLTEILAALDQAEVGETDRLAQLDTALGSTGTLQSAATHSLDLARVAWAATELPASDIERARPPEPERKNLVILLDKVERFWIQGILDMTVPEGAALQLRHRRCSSLVKRPWERLMTFPGDEARSEDQPGAYGAYASGTFDAFERSDRSLLILGEPGSGKTTTLLRLGRELIARARRDPEAPIPVVLNLSSWAEAHGPLDEWIVEELTAKYQIPRELGQGWVNDDRLLLLLDELDGAQHQDHEACIRAINAFRRAHGLTGLVVCGRPADYQASEVRLELGGALMLEPLEPQQITAHVKRSGNRWLEELLERDEELRELARSPLMLEIIERVYEGEDHVELERWVEVAKTSPESALAQRRRQLFGAYVERMNRRASADQRGQAKLSPARMVTQLSWLARQMLAHNQATFLIEQMQPSWLPSRGWRWLYLLMTRLSIATIAGTAWGMVATAGGIHSQLHAGLRRVFAIPGPDEVAIVLVTTGLTALCGLVAALVTGVGFERRRGRPDEASIDPRRGWRDNAILTLCFAVTCVGVHAGAGTLASSALDILGVSVFLGFSLTAHQHRQSWRTDLRAVGALGWSWSRAWCGALTLGLPTGLFVGLTIAILLREQELFYVGSTVVFFFGFGGLRGHELEAGAAPNQGFRSSIRNSLRAGLLMGGLFGVYYTIGLGPGPGVAALLSAMAIGMLGYGLADMIAHVFLRLLLWTSGRAPLDFVGLLEAASSRALLRRVGGGYMFMHRHLIDYFASLPEPADRNVG